MYFAISRTATILSDTSYRDGAKAGAAAALAYLTTQCDRWYGDPAVTPPEPVPPPP